MTRRLVAGSAWTLASPHAIIEPLVAMPSNEMPETPDSQSDREVLRGPPETPRVASVDRSIRMVTPLRADVPAQSRSPLKSAALKILVHGAFLITAVGCLAAYEHFKAQGQSTASLVSLAGAALLGFAPLRDLTRVFFRVEGGALHLVHGLGGLALVSLPLTGVVSGPPILTHAAMAPFAIMGAAQAVMHQNHPRNAAQAAALQTFASSLPEVAQFASAKNLTSPENARRAVSVLSDIIGKAQRLGETELAADPNFQSALGKVTARFGTTMGLDAIQLALSQLSANPATAASVPELRSRLAKARSTIARGETR